MECRLRHTYEVKGSTGQVTCTIVIGEVVLMHVHEGVAGGLVGGGWRVADGGGGGTLLVQSGAAPLVLDVCLPGEQRMGCS